MLVILKIPLIYLGVVVWWAVRAEPEVADGGDEVGVLAPLEPCDWNDRQRRRVRPRRGPVRPRGVRPRVRGHAS